MRGENQRTPSTEIEPWPHTIWWKASALTARATLPPIPFTFFKKTLLHETQLE